MRILLTFLLVLGWPAGGWAKNVALVIGNGAYANVEPLDNPENDADEVTRTLERQGYEVLKATNLTRSQMYNVLRSFRNKADGADIAMVYYAGHGIEVGGQNFLIPVDARLEDERDAQIEMISMDAVLAQLNGAQRLKMVVLDACRDNPFANRMRRDDRGRNVGRGLALVDNVGSGTVVAYAAAAGEVTPDGVSGTNSPFTTAFLNAMNGPAVDVRIFLGAVRDEMQVLVPGSVPFVYSSLGRDRLIINPEGGPEPEQKQSEPEPKVEKPSADDFIRDFAAAEFLNRDDVWEAFLTRYDAYASHPLYSLAVRSKRALQVQEQARIANLDPAPAKNRSSDESGTANQEVAPRPAETQEPAPVPEPAEQDEPDVLALQSAPEDAPEPSPPAPQVPPEVRLKEIQSFLKKRNCYTGRIDGLWGRGSEAGLGRFRRVAGLDVSVSSRSDTRSLDAALASLQEAGAFQCPAPVRKRKPAPTAARKPAPKPAAPVASAPAPAAPKSTGRSWQSGGYCGSTDLTDAQRESGC